MKPRLITCLCVALLALTGCANERHTQSRPTGGQRAGAAPAREILPTDGAMAVFRAKVDPVLCEYARNLKSAAQAIAEASSDAGGPVDASAPEGAQSEYAGAMQNFSNVLRVALRGFRSVSAPAEISAEYRSFITSLASVSRQADKVATYAAARNYAEIAAMENIATPTAGDGVFQAAGITGCGASNS
jgi:hypothetical protein